MPRTEAKITKGRAQDALDPSAPCDAVNHAPPAETRRLRQKPGQRRTHSAQQRRRGLAYPRDTATISVSPRTRLTGTMFFSSRAPRPKCIGTASGSLALRHVRARIRRA